jgi:spore coat protein A
MKTRGPIPRLLGLLFLALGAAAPAMAETAAIEADRDNTLYEDVQGDFSNGAGSYFFAGHTNEALKRRGLLHFNVAAQIPSGSTVTAVTLALYQSRTRDRDDLPVSLHRALRDWGEGASNADAEEGSGAAAATGDATWFHTFYPNLRWANPGGDFSSTASATTIVGRTSGAYTWSSAGMVADVQGWLNNPAANFGWLVLGVETGAKTAHRFDTHENTTLANRPRLSVTYTPPTLTGACCIAGLCQILTTTECAGLGGTFQGNNTTCSPNSCTQPTGACCSAAGSCTVATSSTCSSIGGSYQGDSTSCNPNPCPQPTGACCAPNGTCSSLTQTQCSTQGGTYRGDGTLCDGLHCPVVLTPFVDPLPVPAAAQPISGSPGGVATYSMRIQEFQQKLHRDLPPTTVWGFNGGYPGATIEASTGAPVTVEWENDLRNSLGFLRTEHYLPVDTCLMGPDEHGAAPRVVFHLHGGHVPPAADGYPEATLLPGEGATYVYPNNQLPGTLWYHDHALGITRLNVYMGLAGFYLLRDSFENALNLPRGEFEIPLAIQDRTFRGDGSLEYPAQWTDHFHGDTILVNGKVWPYLNVRQGKYRFRALNGSTSRTYTLALSHAGMQFFQIGTEGGLLPAPVPLSTVTLGPGERADLVVDFEGIPVGTEILLTNSAPIMFPGSPGEGVIPNVMKFIVTSQGGDTDPLPASLRPVPAIPEEEAVQHRQFELRKMENSCTGSMWSINGLGWHDITEFPEIGTTEVWSFINRSGVSHPMHMHLVMFQVLDRQPFTVVDGVITPAGQRVPPPPQEAGWKDTVMVHPSEILRVIARFEDYTGRYAYHCHILEHEDHEMMRQFQAIDCGNNLVEPTEGCDDGDTLDGDLCSARCRNEEFVALTGTAQGGSVTLTVEGVQIQVTTAPGESAGQVLARLAEAIGGDPELQGLGVSAFISAGALVVGGAVTDIDNADAGLQERLTLLALPDRLWWSSVSNRVGYDLVRGSLRALAQSGGDFTSATQECLADNAAATGLLYSPAPAAGDGWWFLVRSVSPAGPGTYDDGTQSGSRDAGISASGSSCP